MTTRSGHPLPVLLRFLRPYPVQALLSVLLGFLTVASGVALLGTSAYLIAYAALQPSISVLQVAIVGVRFFGISRAVFRYLERLVSHDVNFRLLAGLRVWLYARLEPLAPARLQHMRSADLLSRAVADIESLENFYLRALAPPLVALLVTVGAGIFMSSYDPRLGILLVCALLLAGVGLPVLIHRLARAPGEAVITARVELNNALLDAVQGTADLLAFGQSTAQQEKIRAAGERLGAAQERQASAGALGDTLGLLISGLALWGLLLLAAPQVGLAFDGIGLAVLALVCLASFEAVTPLTQAAQHLAGSFRAGRRLFSLAAQQPPVVDAAEPLPLAAGPLHLRIRELGFCYPGAAEPALEGFDLDLPPGKRVALVGASGAGKTTLFNLLMRFWEYERGSIELNGRDIRCYAAEDVRRQIALVGQATYLFAGTLRQNLLLANPNAGDEDLKRAVDRAQLSELVALLPDGLDTWVGERGLQLSAGERQRVAVARALLQRAPLLLLDEPSAHVDAATEQRLLAAICQSCPESSLVFITHRLVEMETMDEIIVLRAGRVIERGGHAELLAAGGEYAQLWKIQSERIG